MARRICHALIIASLASALACATASAKSDTAPQGVVVRIETNDAASSAGVVLSQAAVATAAAGLTDHQPVTVHRGAETADSVVSSIGHGVALVQVRGGSGGVATLAAGDPAVTTQIQVIQSNLDPTDGSFVAGPHGALRLAGPTPTASAVLLNGCSEVVGFATSDGTVVPVSAIVAAAVAKDIAVTRAAAPCGAAPTPVLTDLQDQVRNMRRQLDAAHTAAERHQLQTRIDALNRRIQDELAAQKARADQLAQENKRQAQAQAKQDRITIIAAAAAGGVLLLVIGLAIWLGLRGRKLNKSLAEARKDNKGWNDCVLESETGITVKLPGTKLLKGGVVLGRSREDADVVVDKDDVSRRHARFEVLNNELNVRDLGSTNKTYVNGKEVERGLVKRLQEGDKVSIGSNEFTVRILRNKAD